MFHKFDSMNLICIVCKLMYPAWVAGKGKEYSHGHMLACRERRLMALPVNGDIESCLKYLFGLMGR
jgi:hypothetical protein